MPKPDQGSSSEIGLKERARQEYLSKGFIDGATIRTTEERKSLLARIGDNAVEVVDLNSAPPKSYPGLKLKTFQDAGAIGFSLSENAAIFIAQWRRPDHPLDDYLFKIEETPKATPKE